MNKAALIGGEGARKSRLGAFGRFSGLATSAGLMLLVFEGDLLTKKLVATPPGAFHERPAWAAAPVLILAFFIMWIARDGLYPLSLLAGGFLANGVDLLDGVGQNPFVWATGGGQAVAFNLADAAIIVGGTLTVWRLASRWWERRHGGRPPRAPRRTPSE